MKARAHATVRNAGWLTVQRGVHVVGALTFAMLAPRLMGPQDFGRYALLASLSDWFSLLSGLGLINLIGRRVPELEGPDRAGLQRFFSNLLGLKIVSATASAALFVAVCCVWLRDLDPWAVAAVAGTILVGGLSSLFFGLFLGLNQGARWGLGDILARWLWLVLVLVGFRLAGVPGACLGLLLTDGIVLIVGVWWVRPHVSPWPPRLEPGYLAPQLGFALMFFGSGLLQSGADAGGGVLLRGLSGDYAQVGYYRLAYSVFLTLGALLPQLALSFAPLFTSLRLQGRLDTLRDWVERLLAILAVGGVWVVYAALFLARDVTPWVFGPGYAPVADNLLPLMAALPVLGLTSLTRVLNVALDRPGVELRAAAIRLAAFGLLGVPLVSRWGSMGAAWATLAALIGSAVYVMRRTTPVVGCSLRPWWTALALGAVFLPLAALRGSPAWNLALFLASTAGYGALLFAFKVVTPEGLAAAWAALRRPSAPESPMTQTSE
jgi:O-antigen/teichoic acid export membrane protein